MSRTLLTPQGDGNWRWYQSHSPAYLRVCPAPSLPRKGTETFLLDYNKRCRLPPTSRTLLTPQGDGNVRQACLLEICSRKVSLSPAPSLPRKGTETKREKASRANIQTKSRTLLTPQGDGNFPKREILRSFINDVPHPPYPPRGRKHKSVDYLAAYYPVPHPPYPARGRKRSVTYCSTIESFDECPAPSLPRKGTETDSAGCRGS